MSQRTHRPHDAYASSPSNNSTTAASRAPRSHTSRAPSPRALVIAVQLPHQSLEQVQTSIFELTRLAGGLGIQAVHTSIQKRSSSSTPALIGEGKLRELAMLTGGPGVIPTGPIAERPAAGEAGRDAAADLVLVDLELSPAQRRNLEVVLGVEVVDRTELILRVFERYAQTLEARLQVEIARLVYALPRLRDDRSMGDREGGGGRGGRGHTNVELARQQIRERIAGLRRNLEEVQAAESSRQARRKGTHRVALVGYTNAGKSSIMRALTGSEVLVEDRLFATLGTTVRAISPESTPRILVSDTVGFIRNLPHALVAPFHSTLEEAREAGLLLLVVDAADPGWREQLAVTRQTLEAIGAGAVPSRVVLNKIDRVEAEARAALERELPDALQVSAYDAGDVGRVREVILAFFDGQLEEEVLVVPFEEGRLIGEIHAGGRVIDERFTETGVVLRVRALPEVLERWRAALPTPSAVHPDDHAAATSAKCALDTARRLSCSVVHGTTFNEREK